MSIITIVLILLLNLVNDEDDLVLASTYILNSMSFALLVFIGLYFVGVV